MTKTIGEALTAGGPIGNPDAVCPHCGRRPRELRVVTPRLKIEMVFHIPPTGCCSKNRRLP